MRHLKLTGVILLASVIQSSYLYAIDLAIMPVRPKAITEATYQPFAEYLSKATGEHIHLKAYKNFVDYWQDMRDGKFELALDAAHFVDFRIKKHQHQVLAKIEDQVSFSLVSTEEYSILEASELIGKPIACLPPPSRGNLEIDSFFKNPIRQPRKSEVLSYEEGVEKLKAGEVMAAIVPTPMLNGFPELQVVDTTELWPHMAVTSSSDIETKTKAAIVKALLGITRDQQGSDALSKLGFSGFEPTDGTTYDGYSKHLSTYGRVHF